MKKKAEEIKEVEDVKEIETPETENPETQKENNMPQQNNTEKREDAPELLANETAQNGKKKRARKVQPEEIQLANEWIKQIRRNTFAIAKMIVKDENKDSYIEKMNECFTTANHSICDLMNEIQFMHQINHLSKDQIEVLKKMLNK